MLPSQVLRERVVTCFIDDPTGVKLRHDIGIDTITWECDYPHSDSTWPTSPETLWKEIGEIPDEDIDKITHLNAMRVYHFDPFSIRPREKCTVRSAAGRGDRRLHRLPPRAQARGAPRYGIGAP